MKTKLPKEVQKVLKKLTDAGFSAYIVGGSVRNIVMGKKVKDWDFATNALPHQIREFFKNSFYDNKFGTVGVPVKMSNVKCQMSNVIFEITTFRKEFGYSDFRHPDKIIFADTIEEDLKRRDFTVNAMAFDGKNLTDPFKGRSDIDKMKIRAVGDPHKRFSEDALRLLRAIRFAAKLEFVIEDKTLRAIKQNASLILKIANERVKGELFNILSTDHPAEAILFMRNTNLLGYVLPELEKCFGVEQKSPKRHHKWDVGTHLVKSLKFCPSKDPLVRFATLLHDIGKPKTFKQKKDGVITFYNHEIVGATIVREIARRLKFSKKEKEKLMKLVRWHQFTVDEKQTDSALRRFIRNVGKDNIPDMIDLRIGDRLGGGARETSWRLELFKKRLIEVQKQPFTVNDLKVNGYDVMEILNLKPGPEVGEVLESLYDDVVEKKVPNEKEVLLERLRENKVSN